MVFAKRELHVTALGNADGVLERLVLIREQASHLVLGFEVKFLAAEAHTVRVVHGLAHLDAHEHILRAGVLFFKVMRVIRHHERQTCFARKAQNLRVHGALLGKPVILKLQKEIALTENRGVFQGGGLCRLVIVVQDALRNTTRKARRQCDQPLVVRPQQLQIDTRTVIKALHIRLRDHVAEVMIARLVFAQEHQMIALAVECVDLVKARARRDIDLAADDGLDARRLCRLVKVDHAVHIAVVGDGDRRLSQLLHARDEVADAARAVEQAELGMNMEVDKSHGVLPYCVPASSTSLRIRWFMADLETGGSDCSASSASVASGFFSRSSAVRRSFSGSC